MSIPQFPMENEIEDTSSGRRGLPVPGGAGTTFQDYFRDSEEEAQEARNTTVRRVNDHTDYGSGTVEKLLDRSVAEMREKYPLGGLKASRFITTQVLMTAGTDYFSAYDEVVQTSVEIVRNSLAETKERSDIVAKASEDPTNEEVQEDAYRLIYALAVDTLKNKPLRNLEKRLALSLITNEIIGFGPLDPLWRDKSITEIIVNGPADVKVEIQGQLYRVPACRFRDRAHLGSLIERLYRGVGKVLSASDPQLNGRLHDFSRMYAQDVSISPAGPNFNIRRHRDEYLPPEQYLAWGALSQEMLEDLGNLVYRGAGILISGGTGTGKTTLLNALSAYIPPAQQIVTLEDNLEMKLHPRKFMAAPSETVEPRRNVPGDRGVSMRDLVKGALRSRPDWIIVGEIRDEAAYDLCQALNTGHSGASTVHANNEKMAVYRMVSLVSQGGLMGGDAAYPLISAAFNIIVQLERFPDGSRRVVSISEVAPFPRTNPDTGRMELETTQLWKFEVDSLVDGKVVGNWVRKAELSQDRRELLLMDTAPPLTWEQLQKLAQL